MIRKCRLTIPVTNHMATDYGDSLEKVLNSHATDRGAPVDLVSPVKSSGCAPQVTEFTWEWFVVDKLPAPSAGQGRSLGYLTRWDSCGVVDDDPGRPIQVFGMGYLSAEATEKTALEMLAAVQAVRERMKTDDALQD